MEEEGGRFGYCYENGALAEVIRSLRPLPNVKISGLHLHSSTQSRTVNVYGALARTAVKIAQEYELNLSYVDMGGGYFAAGTTSPTTGTISPPSAGSFVPLSIRRKPF